MTIPVRLIRVCSIAVATVTAWGAWYVSPGLLAGENLRYASGIVAVLWGLEFWLFQKVTALSGLEGLTSREGQRLVHKLRGIRKRIWWIGGMGLLSSVAIYLLAEFKLPASSPTYAAMVGVLIGISISYMILIPAWVEDVQGFIDRVKLEELEAKSRAKAADQLATLRKPKK